MAARAALAALLLVIAAPAAATVRVLYDSGATISAAPYIEDLFTADPTPAPPTPPPPFPIRTPAMQPGRLTQRLTAARRERLAALPRPVVLLGSDLASRRWLAHHRDDLVAGNALVMVVDAPSPAAFEAVQAVAGPLPLLPRSASDIAASLGLRVYPVILSAEGLAQ